MHDTIASLIVAVYPDREAAEHDFEAVRRQDYAGGFEIVDAALIHTDEHGRVELRKRTKSSWRNWSGSRGGMAVHFRRGLRAEDVRELGEKLVGSSAAMVAVGRGPGVEQVIPGLASVEVVVNQVTGRDLAIRSLLGTYSGY